MLSLQECCCLLLLLSLAAAAPLQKAAGVPGNVNEVENQEEELQSLLQLADEKGARSDVAVHEEHVQHLHEVNGQQMEVDTNRKTVSDTKTGEVLSDVKQEVSKTDGGAGAVQPEVQVKTEVDVPAEGVHETIVQSGSEADKPSEEEEEEEEEEAEEVEFSPEAVADYLYRTGDFNRFYAALAQLVNASIMTEEEAQSYSQLVAAEYDRLQVEDYENSILPLQVQRRVPSLMEQYPVAMDTPNSYPLPLVATQQEGYPVAMETPEALYGLEQEPSVKDLDLEFDPYELLYALWNEAYGTGDSRAQALVGELFDKVRGDNDPDDEGQVRDILLDLIGNSVMNDESQPQQPVYGWQPIVDAETDPEQPMESPLPSQPIMDADTAQVQPMENPVPLQPIPEVEDEEAANELMAQSEKRDAEEPTLSKDTKLDQPAEKQNTNAASEPQPMGKSDSHTDNKTSQDSNVASQAASEPLQTQKRAAETV